MVPVDCPEGVPAVDPGVVNKEGVVSVFSSSVVSGPSVVVESVLELVPSVVDREGVEGLVGALGLLDSVVELLDTSVEVEGLAGVVGVAEVLDSAGELLDPSVEVGGLV